MKVFLVCVEKVVVSESPELDQARGFGEYGGAGLSQKGLERMGGPARKLTVGRRIAEAQVTETKGEEGRRDRGMERRGFGARCLARKADGERGKKTMMI